MAAFDPITCRILLNTGRSFSRADVKQIPAHSDVTMSLSHEYIHFVQSVSSVSGFRLLAELIDFGIYGALVLSGLATGHGGKIAGSRHIVPLLKAQSDRAGRGNPDIHQRATAIADEARALLMEHEYPYSGSRQPGDLDHQEIRYGTYQEPFWGFVTLRKTFRPITPGMLSEGMARRMDQWLKANQGFSAHSWDQSIPEAEYYNGLRNLLLQPRYEKNVIASTVDRITVIISYLALATPRPDHAVKAMLDRLEMNVTAGGLPDAIALEMRDVLVREKMLHADNFNEVMDGILNGIGRIMDRSEWLSIHEQLRNIQVGGNTVLSHPARFADDTITWHNVREWMVQHTLPPVIAVDGSVALVNGVPVVSTVTGFLEEVERVLL